MTHCILIWTAPIHHFLFSIIDLAAISLTVDVTLSKAKDILAFVGIVNIACLNSEAINQFVTIL